MRMRGTFRQLSIACVTAVLFGLANTAAVSQSSLSPGYAAGDEGLTPAERAGREIWFFATAFNDRFYTYSYPQRLGGYIDWFRILAAERKGDLFQAWGAIPDPDCCVPGAPNCPARSLEETYGFQWCPGDEDLLAHVGKEGYSDPACDFVDSPFNMSTPHGAKDQRQSACDLKFGTSTGVLGLRKFPNPRFDRTKWERLNGSLATWEGYAKALADDSDSPDARISPLFDGSVEPPFRIGMACGACHIAYDPLNAPADPDNPAWENINGLVGNQYSRVSQMLASGMSPHRIEWQLIAVTRPGIVDTSALPMDTVSNPGTMNAIINFARRPLHEHRIVKWHKAASCEAGATDSECWCEPGRESKCWQRRESVEAVPNILKGGEDSIGVPEAIQRVYFNIGSCAEQCWLNHVPDMRAVDPRQRNYGQTPFDIGQCRRDCAGFRAIEDRLDDVVAFFLSERPADLWKARGLSGPEELVSALDEEFFPGAVELGRSVFAQRCAACHSSQGPPFDDKDFHATDPADPTLRLDWLSSEAPILASRIGTYPARALHSNHMPSRVWEQYASLSLWERTEDKSRPEVMKGSGRGYYRAPSLLSAWAYAPFMLNNAIGPEICGKPDEPSVDFYVSPYVDADDRPAADAPACRPFDPSLEGRWQLYLDSMDELLNPDRRGRKVQLTNEDIVVDIAPQMKIGDLETGLSVSVPAGVPAVTMNSLRYKDLIQDMVLNERNAEMLGRKYADLLSDEQLQEVKTGLAELRGVLLSRAGPLKLDLSAEHADFIQRYYSNVLSHQENAGHTFGADLADQEKQALIAFLATL